MNESKKHEPRTIRKDVMENDVKEIKDMLTQLQKSLKQSQKVNGFQFVFGLGLAAMVVGMTLTGH